MGLCVKMLMSVPMQVHVVQMQIAAILMEATFVIVWLDSLVMAWLAMVWFIKHYLHFD